LEDKLLKKILDSEPFEIAEKLGIDPNIGEIIYKETKKAINKINSDLIFFNNKYGGLDNNKPWLSSF
jgi:hypothetical protein